MPKADKVQSVDKNSSQRQEIRKLLTDFFKTYYNGFVDGKSPELEKYVVENNNTKLYLSMLKNNVDNSIILGTGYKNYKLNITDCNIKILDSNNCELKLVYDLEYHYKMSEDILSADYNNIYNIEITGIHDGKLKISNILSSSQVYDNFKEKITKTCIKDNGRLSVKNYCTNLKKVSREIKNETQEIKKELGIHPEKKLSNHYAYIEKEDEKKTTLDKMGQVFFDTLSFVDGSKRAMAASKRTYSPANGVKYAKKYAYVGNNKKDKLLFYYVNGGDCTNFVSQCVWAAYGGYSASDISATKKRISNKKYMTSSWYGGSGGGHKNWENVTNFSSYVSSKKTYGPQGKIYNNNGKCTKLTGIQLGDVIQMKAAKAKRYSHSLYVTQVNYTPGAGSTYFVSCHSTDALNKSLATVYSEWGKNSYARRISFRDAKFR